MSQRSIIYMLYIKNATKIPIIGHFFFLSAHVGKKEFRLRQEIAFLCYNVHDLKIYPVYPHNVTISMTPSIMTPICSPQKEN